MMIIHRQLKLKTLTILIAILATFAAEAQQPDRDMAERCLQIATDSYNSDTVKKYANISYSIALSLDDRQMVANSLNNLAWAHSNTEEYDSAIVLYHKLLNIIADDDDKPRTAKTFCNLGLCYKATNNYFEMWNSFRQGMELFTQLGDTIQMCWAQRSMGTPYEMLGMFDKAMPLYQDALKLAVSQNDTLEIGCCIHMIARCKMSEYIDSSSRSAVDTLLSTKGQLLTAFHILKDVDMEATLYSENIINLSHCYIRLAGLLDRSDYADSCLRYLNIYRRDCMLSVKDTMQHIDAMLIQCENDIFRRHYNKALVVLENLSSRLSDLSQPGTKAEVLRLLVICYKAMGDYQKAFASMVKQCELVEKSHSDESMKRASNLAAQSDINSARQQQEIFNKRQQELMYTEKSHQRVFYVIISIAFVLIVSAAVLMVIALSRRRMYNSLLKSSNEELSSLREELEQQRDAEEAARSIITGSVEYAYEIQTETIGNPAKVKELFPESFVYYRPRDIVSGDWYLTTIVRGHKLIACADCTGHGIPGALLSMLGVSALKDILNNIESSDSPVLPGEILDNMRISVKKSLNKNSETEVKRVDDGMDMTILVFPPEGGVMLFGGANQSAILVQDGNAVRLKGDSNPIGNYIREKEHFATITTEIHSGDVVYMFSDGIQDQVGGEESRKFSLRRVTSFIIDNYQLPMPEQLRRLGEELDSWTGSISQVDDRTMIGIRI